MTNKLQQYFPMIRTREEVLNEIESKSRLKNLFYEWTEENQNEFLDFCTGVKGIKIMYDFMIKEILNYRYGSTTGRWKYCDSGNSENRILFSGRKKCLLLSRSVASAV